MYFSCCYALLLCAPPSPPLVSRRAQKIFLLRWRWRRRLTLTTQRSEGAVLYWKKIFFCVSITKKFYVHEPFFCVCCLCWSLTIWQQRGGGSGRKKIFFFCCCCMLPLQPFFLVLCTSSSLLFQIPYNTHTYDIASKLASISLIVGRYLYIKYEIYKFKKIHKKIKTKAKKRGKKYICFIMQW